MPKFDLIEEDIKWCEANRNPEQQVYQDGFIAGLYHALFLMKSRPTPRALDADYWICESCGSTNTAAEENCYWCESPRQ